MYDIIVQKENVLKESYTKNPNYCDKRYIIYISESNIEPQRIHINTDYFETEDKYNLCKWYDRILCNTIDEYINLGIEYVESQAYGAWMDGAH